MIEPIVGDTGEASPSEVQLVEFSSLKDNKPKPTQGTAIELRDGFKEASRNALVNVPATDDSKRAGKAVSLCTYKERTTRGNKNVQAMTGYVIDLDGKTPEEVATIKTRLIELGLFAFGYTTWSHGWAKEGECWRFVIPFASPVDAEAWSARWPRLNNHLAIGMNDPATKDCARLHLAPRAPKVVPRDGVDVENSPPCWWENDGKLFDVNSDLPQDSPTGLISIEDVIAGVDRDIAVSSDIERRAINYIAKMPPAIQGQNGSSSAMKVSRALVDRFNLSIETAFALFKEHYNQRCVPPWSDDAIRHKLESVARSPQPGALLGAESWDDEESEFSPKKDRQRSKNGKHGSVGHIGNVDDLPLIPRCAADIEPEEIEWLYPGFLPFGKLVIVDGEPGLGKSMMTLDIVARLSRGEALPGMDEPPPATASLLLCAEDGEGDTIVPRLNAAGSDLRLVHIACDVRMKDGTARMPTLPLFVDKIEEQARACSAKLIIIDPLVAYLGEDIKSHVDADVRRALKPLCDMAQRLGACVVGVRHLNKKTGESAMNRGGGSIAFVAAARVGLLVSIHPSSVNKAPAEQHRVLSVVKCNIALKAPSRSFLVVDNGSGPRIEWTNEADVSADEAVGSERFKNNMPRAERWSAAREFLQELLSNGPLPPEEVIERAAGEGISKSTLQRAKKGIVRSSKEGAVWSWNLIERVTVNDDQESVKGAWDNQSLSFSTVANDDQEIPPPEPSTVAPWRGADAISMVGDDFDEIKEASNGGIGSGDARQRARFRRVEDMLYVRVSDVPAAGSWAQGTWTGLAGSLFMRRVVDEAHLTMMPFPDVPPCVVRFVHNGQESERRRWFACPKCDRRCNVVFTAKPLVHPVRFVCRLCAELRYKSQQLNRLERVSLRMRRAKQRLEKAIIGHGRDSKAATRAQRAVHVAAMLLAAAENEQSTRWMDTYMRKYGHIHKGDPLFGIPMDAQVRASLNRDLKVAKRLKEVGA